ncbi:PH domain-containing protein [Glaciibacter sp. 2TAF33]|uniref:PH domain-containing protein n=1 Tax=Glaciibacter sp. 2TAF33 TaxID=3233015 RepID=UPI003F8FBFA3
MTPLPYRYRPLFGRVLTAAVAVICVVGIVGLVVLGDWASLWPTLWPLLFFAVLVYALFWRPVISIDERGITVVNVLRTVFLPWAALERIDTRYTLTLYTPTRKVPVWAAPGPTARRSTASERGVGGDSSTAGPASLRIANVVTEQWDALRDGGALTESDPETGVTVRTHWITLAALALLLVASIVSALA